MIRHGSSEFLPNASVPHRSGARFCDCSRGAELTEPNNSVLSAGSTYYMSCSRPAYSGPSSALQLCFASDCLQPPPSTLPSYSPASSASSAGSSHFKLVGLEVNDLWIAGILGASSINKDKRHTLSCPQTCTVAAIVEAIATRLPNIADAHPSPATQPPRAPNTRASCRASSQSARLCAILSAWPTTHALDASQAPSRPVWSCRLYSLEWSRCVRLVQSLTRLRAALALWRLPILPYHGMW